jgi:hypothetical protein
MTTKNKAKELFNEYYSYLKANLMNDKEAWEDAKVCALIAVNEILKEKNGCNKYECYGQDINWNKVKQEIEKL